MHVIIANIWVFVSLLSDRTFELLVTKLIKLINVKKILNWLFILKKVFENVLYSLYRSIILIQSLKKLI